tara:strand:- start:657 stop:971 length:315 start_codon:yes stop_codon:yes gene_type:complete
VVLRPAIIESKLFFNEPKFAGKFVFCTRNIFLHGLSSTDYFVLQNGGASMIEQDQAEMLKSRHRKLEDQLEIENTHPYPNKVLVSNLKRQKLRIKDELLSLNAL